MGDALNNTEKEKKNTYRQSLWKVNTLRARQKFVREVLRFLTIVPPGLKEAEQQKQ